MVAGLDDPVLALEPGQPWGILAEQHDEWHTARRYFSPATIAKLTPERGVHMVVTTGDDGGVPSEAVGRYAGVTRAQRAPARWRRVQQS